MTAQEIKKILNDIKKEKDIKNIDLYGAEKEILYFDPAELRGRRLA